ncbi:MAG: insulinase family protein [Bryobacteraceae bacterium]|nr:insulinase family protein [Bryobacteraceae bacterium]
MSIYPNRNRLLAGLFGCVIAATAQNVADLEKRITEFDLPNGLHFIVLERHTAPVFAGLSFVNAGAANDPAGKAGIAHMFEHMAFKGTPSIGSKNYAAEKAAMDALEKTYDLLEEERRKGPRADQARIKKLEADVKSGIDATFAQVDQDAFTRMVEENGAVGLNAGTSMDSTVYFMNLPANRLEMWFMLESDRFITPVFREFYKERGVVRNEYAMRIESDPQGRLITALMNTAFADSPYHVGYAGIPSDIENLRVADALAFRKTYYVPGNITIVVAGDVDPKQVRALATKYFGPMPAGPLPPPVISREQEQRGEKRVAIETDAQPMMAIGYKRPDALHADDPVFDVISGILSQGRTGRLYKELVEEKKIALGAAAYATFPGGKQDNLYILFTVPNSGKTIEELEKATYEIVEKLKKEPVDDATLKRVKINVRAGLIRALNSNMGMANALASAHVGYGNWKKLYSALDDVEKITAADVQRVAQTYFTAKGRTVAFMTKSTTQEAK